MPFPSAEKAIPEFAGWRWTSVKNAAAQALKFSVAAGVLVYLYVRGDIAWEPLRTALQRWQYSVPAFLLLTLMPLAQFWRWQCLLRASHLHLPHREVFSYLMVSKFFNTALPGYISGDVIRGFYVFRRASKVEPPAGKPSAGKPPAGKPSAVVASIVFDRTAGLIPLFFLCLIGLLGSLDKPLPGPVVAAVGSITGVGLLLPLGLFLWTYRRPQPAPFLLRLSRWIRLDRSLAALYQDAHQYVRDWKLIGNILGISFLNQGLAIASFTLSGFALQMQTPLMSYLLLVPLGLLVTAIPLSPAGLGVGQVAFLALFHLAGTAQGANLFTLYMASYVLINLAGALLYLFPRLGAPRPQPASAPKIQTE